jgi:large subunit ribosomal protein L24
VLSIQGEQVVIEAINRVKRHTRPNPQANHPGGIVEKEMPLPRSKVALFNPATKKAGRTGVRKLADGRRVRFFKSNGEVIDA